VGSGPTGNMFCARCVAETIRDILLIAAIRAAIRESAFGRGRAEAEADATIKIKYRGDT
jgi:hypothetical protein